MRKATIRPIAEPTIRWFKARYSGKCATCEAAFFDGDHIGYTDDHAIVGLDCCGGSETMTLTPEHPPTGVDFDSFNRGRQPNVNIMPTGKTAKDKCPRCWIIHTVGQGDEC